jgi:hypothetical protein
VNVRATKKAATNARGSLQPGNQCLAWNQKTASGLITTEAYLLYARRARNDRAENTGPKRPQAVRQASAESDNYLERQPD